jgi:hypothetical protein
MPIDFACSCGRRLRVPDRFAGKFARCPNCRALAMVPGSQNGRGGPETGEDDNDQQFVWNKSRLDFVPDRPREPAAENCKLDVVEEDPPAESCALEAVEEVTPVDECDLEVIEGEESAEGPDFEVVEEGEAPAASERVTAKPKAKAPPKLNDAADDEESDRPRKNKKKKLQPEDAKGMAELYKTKGYWELMAEQEEKRRTYRSRGRLMSDGLTLFGVHVTGAVITGSFMLISGLMSLAVIGASLSQGWMVGPRIMAYAAAYTIFGAIILVRSLVFGQED